MQTIELKTKLKKQLLNADSIKSLLHNNQSLPHEVFVSKAIGTIMSNENLQQCDISSIMQSCIKSAQLGLPVDASGYAYLVPFKGQCTFQIGAKGYIELCKRNKNVLQIIHNAVYEGDEFDYFQDENGFHYKHKIALNGKYNREKRDGLLCVYATIKYINGGSETQLMDVRSIEAIKGCAQTTYIWDRWYTEKAITAVIKRLLKRQHLMNIQDALEKDDSEKENIIRINDVEDMIYVTEEEIKTIQDLLEKTGESAQSICEIYNINSLPELPQSKFNILKNKLNLKLSNQ